MKRWILVASLAAFVATTTTSADEMTIEKVDDSIPANVPPSHMVREGDTLWDITGRYYGDPYRWPQVWSFNPEITNPHWIYPDGSVRLRPTGETAQVAAADPGFRLSRSGGRGPAAGTIYLRELGFIDGEALKQTGIIIAANEEMMMMAPSDIVYIRLSEGAEPKIGGDYTIFRDISKEERDESKVGKLVRIMGTVRLQDYDKKRDLGHGLVVEALEPVERGFKIAPMRRRFDAVPAKPNARDLEAQVVASIYPRIILANQQLVFVNAGAQQGVEAGNRFFVVRKGDEWRRLSGRRLGREIQPTAKVPKEPKDYPDEIIAEGRVMSVRPTTCAVLLTQAVRAVAIGDRAVMRQGQ